MPQDGTAFPQDHADALAELLPDYDLAGTEGTTELAAWFLGPKGENSRMFADLVREAVRSHGDERRTTYPDDPVYVTDEMKQTDAYDMAVKRMRVEYEKLLDRLQGSVPHYSYRHQGHMLWDLTIPSMLGYFAAMLYNQNNLAAVASPVTTLLEVAVGKDLCGLLGYPVDVEGALQPWGHIACDGTVANLEALWSARNLKYYPIALARAIANESALAGARDITVVDGSGRRAKLLELTDWALVNLPMDTVLDIPQRMTHCCGVDQAELRRVNSYTIQELGFERFHRDMLDQRLGPPAFLAPATMHYSWPKGASVLGIGQDNIMVVGVDLQARAKIGHRRELLARCRKEMRPVVLDVAVLGSTELSAVDPLATIVDLRDANARDGFYYPVHADAAWGGYFATIRRPAPGPPPTDAYARATVTPELMLSAYVNAQYDALPRADSITIDSHKAGFIPYPAGALCYRNKKQREMVSFSPRYIYHSPFDPSIGHYTIEGSKPGAAAAGVHLSHSVIRPDPSGYGRILGQCLFNSKRLYAGVVTMDAAVDGVPRPYTVTPVQWLPAEREGGDVAAQLKDIHRMIVTRTNAELVACEQAMRLFAELGSDQVIIGYAFNPVVDGAPNTDVEVANEVNRRLFRILSMSPKVGADARAPRPEEVPPLLIMSSSFEPEVYGSEFVADFATRMGLLIPDGEGMDPMPTIEYLVSTTMDPWVSDTSRGDFIPEIIRLLDKAVRKVVKEVSGAG